MREVGGGGCSICYLAGNWVNQYTTQHWRRVVCFGDEAIETFPTYPVHCTGALKFNPMSFCSDSVQTNDWVKKCTKLTLFRFLC